MSFIDSVRWLEGILPDERRCDDDACKTPKVEYLFHMPNRSVYKCCWSCMRTARSVKKAEFIKLIEKDKPYADFQKKRQEHWRETVLKALEKSNEQFFEMEWRAYSEDFYNSKEWQRVRYKALAAHYNKHGHMCACCKARYAPLHVDHIKPRSRHPELALDITNLQVLCKACNLGKSNIDETDFRGDIA